MMTIKTGIYVHIPFCLKKCAYCDFNSQEDLKKADDYFNSLIDEIRCYKDLDEKISTVYFGGGTPSSVDSALIAKVIVALRKKFDLNECEEMTLELNPGTVDSAKLADYQNMGINRLSVGVQSFNDVTLKRLGRIHTSDDVYATIKKARLAGFDNISIDLMYGLPDDRLERLDKDLAIALKLGAEHISAYGLIIEQGTPFYKAHMNGKMNLPEEDDLLDMRRLINEKLQSSGLERYEVSSYARKGFESRHNLIYWNNDNYLGFGVGSSGKIFDRRYRNIRDLNSYINAEPTEKSEAVENLTKDMIIEEGIFLGLRLIKGINLDEFNDRYHIDFKEKYEKFLEELETIGTIELKDNQLRLTDKGHEVSNYCLAKFLS